MVTRYITKDSTMFSKKEDAAEHEEWLRSTLYWRMSYGIKNKLGVIDKKGLVYIQTTWVDYPKDIDIRKTVDLIEQWANQDKFIGKFNNATVERIHREAFDDVEGNYSSYRVIPNLVEFEQAYLACKEDSVEQVKADNIWRENSEYDTWGSL